MNADCFVPSSCSLCHCHISNNLGTIRGSATKKWLYDIALMLVTSKASNDTLLSFKGPKFYCIVMGFGKKGIKDFFCVSLPNTETKNEPLSTFFGVKNPRIITKNCF
jgi:hypothetical protein